MKYQALLKRLLAGAATLAFAAASALPALAQGTTIPAGIDTKPITGEGEKATITVKAPTNETSVEGITVSIYRVLDKVESEVLADEDTDPAGNTEKSLYTVVKRFAPFFATAYQNYMNGVTGSEGNPTPLKDQTSLKIVYDSTDNCLKISAPTDEEKAGVEGEYIIIDNSVGNKLDETEKFFAASLIAHIQGSNTAPSDDGGTTDDSEQTSPTVAKIGSAADAATLSSWLSRYIMKMAESESGFEPNQQKSFDKNNGGVKEKVQFTVNQGYFVILFSKEKTELNTETVIYQSALQVSGDVDITPKLNTITLEKTVQNLTNKGSTVDTEQASGKETSAAVGDTLQYTVTSQIPDLTHYDLGSYTENYSVPTGEKWHYYFSDTMEHQRLATDVNGKYEVTITIGTNAAISVNDSKAFNITASDDKSVTIAKLLTYDTDPGKFDIVFNLKALKENDLDGKDIKVEYKAILQKDAATQNENNVTLNYSNNPYDQASRDNLTDKTTVYTYDLEILKEFSDQSTTYTDVEFQLKKGDAALNFWGSDGVYTLAEKEVSKEESPNEHTTKTLTLSTAGKLSIHGLGENVYTLEETKAPSGYIKASAFTVTLQAVEKTPSQLETDTKKTSYTKVENAGKEVKYTALSDNSKIGIAFNVLNQKGFLLPTTGGDGTWVLTVGGILLFAAAAVVLHFARRKKD